MKSPPEFWEFFVKLAKNSLACGIFQARSEQRVFDAVTLVVSGSMDLFKSSNHAYLTPLCATLLDPRFKMAWHNPEETDEMNEAKRKVL